MDSRTGDRGVSEVMGFILVFGMLVLSFTVYQGIVVPDQNRQVEFEHNQAVQGQFQDLRNAIVSTAATGSGRAVSVALGASYPTRAIAQNLGISGGSIQTTDGSSIQIHNAEALDGEARDYLDGSQRTFETKSIRYTPVYSFYSGAPETMYENTVAYNQFGDTNLTLTDQVIVDGRRITLVALNGSLSKAQRDTVSISTEAISASSNRVAVRNSTGGQVNITVPTRLSATDWEEALEDEMGSSGYVEGVYAIPGEAAVNISMKRGVTYELRMAKIGVGDMTAEEPAKYVVSIKGDGANVPEGGTQEVVVEVRDRFNNPVSNVTVSNSSGMPDVGSISPKSETTDSNGRASFTYSAPENVNGAEDVTVEFSFDGDGTVNETVTFEVKVLDSDGSGGNGGGGSGGNINPATTGSLILQDAVIGGAPCSDSSCIALMLENTADTDKTITAARFVFYGVDRQSNNAPPPPGSADFVGNLLVNGGDYNPDVNVQFSANSQETVQLEMYQSDTGTSSYNDLNQGDFIVLAVIIDDGESSATYFVAPQEP